MSARSKRIIDLTTRHKEPLLKSPNQSHATVSNDSVESPEDPFSTTSDQDPSYSAEQSSSTDDELVEPPNRKKRREKLTDFFRRKQDNHTETGQGKLLQQENTQGTDLTKSSSYENVSILDGKFFKVTKLENDNVAASCQLCMPQLKIIKGKVQSSSNFVRHVKRVHPDKVQEYNSYKQSKKHSRKRSIMETEELGTSGKQSKLMQPTLQATLTRDTKKTVISQTVFEKRIENFVLSTMSALSIIEHQSFLALFQGMNLNVPCRKTLMKRINESHTQNMCNIKSKLTNIDFVCTTADIWSNKRRSFLGVTVHWIENDFNRGSAAIACKRFTGTHSYRHIAEMLENINLNLGLTENKIVGTITDNGSNFVKAFKEFHAEEDEDIIEEDTFVAVNLNIDGEAEPEEFSLPKHFRCASHTMNLIGTTDYKNFITKNKFLQTRHTNAFSKCGLLWRKSNKPKSNEVIQNILGHTLTSPGVTRWNSTYDSVSQIIKEKSKLGILSRALEIEPFKDTEVLYLEEYCSAMKPLADTLDFLQGDNNTFYGYLLPSLVSLTNKYEKMSQTQKYIYGGDHISQMCLESLRKRFSDILTLKNKDAVIAAVLLPQFKLRWYNIIKDPSLTIENIKKYIIEAAESLHDSNSDLSISNDDENTMKNIDNFFDFSEDKESLTYNVTCGSKSKTSKIELELLRYLEDKKKNLTSLNEYPVLKELSIKFNTCLPSSGAVERLFSFATIIDAPRRNALSDENFEILVLSKANNK